MQLDGNASSDPDNQTLSFAWTLTEQPAASAATLTNPNTATPSFIADVAGAYTAMLTVTDTDQASIQDSVTITAEAPLSVDITTPAESFLTNATQIAVNGTVDNRITGVDVNGVPATLSGTNFTAVVLLEEGNNTLTAVARSNTGQTGQASVRVVRDTTPPNVIIESPGAGQTVTSDAITVSGLVNDIVTGTVNQQNGEVIVTGPGGSLTAAISNRSFVAKDLRLNLGANTLTAVATDTAGNAGTPFQILVTRVAPQGPEIRIIAGNDQSGTISTLLAVPLEVELVDAAGSPIPNRDVLFRVLRNNGLLNAAGVPQAEPELTMATGSGGQAALEWTLGNRAGAGNNRIEVSAAGVGIAQVFSASAVPAPCDRLLTLSGENQLGAVGQALAHSFEVVALNSGGNVCAGLPVTFQVDQGGGNFNGANQVTVSTNSDGRAQAVLTLGTQAGTNNQVAIASFAGLAGLPATFRASAVVPGPESDTRFAGVVLDTENLPIPQVLVEIQNANPPVQAFTGANGQFTLDQVPVGRGHLIVMTPTTTRPGGWPMLAFDIDVIAGIDNNLGMPIFIPPLDTGNFQLVGGSQDVTLHMAGIEALELKVFANSATFPSGATTGLMGLSQVSNDQVPMPPIGGAAPPWIWTLQPAGAILDPPAQLTAPNAWGLPPGQIVDIVSFDHDLGQFNSSASARPRCKPAARPSCPIRAVGCARRDEAIRRPRRLRRGRLAEGFRRHNLKLAKEILVTMVRRVTDWSFAIRLPGYVKTGRRLPMALRAMMGTPLR